MGMQDDGEADCWGGGSAGVSFIGLVKMGGAIIRVVHLKLYMQVLLA